MHIIKLLLPIFVGFHTKFMCVSIYITAMAMIDDEEVLHGRVSPIKKGIFRGKRKNN